VEHTILANGIRQEHTGGLVLRQLHIGLAVGFAIVACLTAFGGGIIVGMWYKANEQSAPVSTAGTLTPAEQPAQGPETASQPQEPPVTFYNTLTNSNVAYAPLTPPASPPGSAKGTVAPASAAAAGSTPARGPAAGGAAGSTKATTASKATPAAAGTPRTATLHETQKRTKATPVAKAAPAETAEAPGGAKTVAQKPGASIRQAGKDTGTQRPAVATATAPGAEEGSARGQAAAGSGQDQRYRVRVGGYTERTAAGQTAQHLTAQEQVPAIVAGKD